MGRIKLFRIVETDKTGGLGPEGLQTLVFGDHVRIRRSLNVPGHISRPRNLVLVQS